MQRYDKLVRDRIPDIIRAKGTEPKVRLAASDSEYAQLLRDKLQEEVGEYLRDGNPEELADIMEVVHALAALTGHTPVHVEEMRAAKAAQRGGFRDRVVLEEA